MASDDATRRQLYALLERDTSPETAALLMDHIPPGGWPDFTTKGDIDRLDARFEQVDGRFQQVDARFRQVDARFERIDARFDRVEMKIDAMGDRLLATMHAELAAHAKHFVYGSIGIVLATASVVLGAARLA